MLPEVTASVGLVVAVPVRVTMLKIIRCDGLYCSVQVTVELPEEEE